MNPREWKVRLVTLVVNDKSNSERDCWADLVHVREVLPEDENILPGALEWQVAHLTNQIETLRAENERLNETLKANPTLTERKLEIATKQLKAVPQITFETLLEITAWMGIPEHKRQACISERLANVKYIIDKALAEIENLK